MLTTSPSIHNGHFLISLLPDLAVIVYGGGQSNTKPGKTAGMEREEKETHFDRGQRAEYVAELSRIIEEDLRSAMNESGEVAKYHVVNLAPEKFTIDPEEGDFATVSDWLRDITSYLAQADAQVFVSVGDQSWKFHWFGPRAKRGYIVHTQPKSNEEVPLR